MGRGMEYEYGTLVAKEEGTTVLQNDKNYSPSDTVSHLVPKV
jgi:hypothetical protein